jgi:hypothetical protein
MYYIYEIPGVKVGCTRIDQFNKRQRVQKNKGQMIILEEHKDIIVASNREIELQKEKEYPVDTILYYHTVNIGSKYSCAKGGLTSTKNPTPYSKLIASQTGKLTSSYKKQCPYCDKISNPAGIGRHLRACKSKP